MLSDVNDIIATPAPEEFQVTPERQSRFNEDHTCYILKEFFFEDESKIQEALSLVLQKTLERNLEAIDSLDKLIKSDKTNPDFILAYERELQFKKEWIPLLSQDVSKIQVHYEY